MVTENLKLKDKKKVKVKLNGMPPLLGKTLVKCIFCQCYTYVIECQSNLFGDSQHPLKYNYKMHMPIFIENATTKLAGTKYTKFAL